MNITLIGDSIFDNKVYVGGGKSTSEHLKDKLEGQGKANLCAVDGAITDGVVRQLPNVPKDTTHLVLSVGGNDALGEMSILSMNDTSSAEVLNELANVTERFERRYEKMLSAVMEAHERLAICTIYYPRMEDELTQKIAVAALASFNDVIIRQAFKNGLPLIDLRYVCDEDADYANPIEPSEAGGFKISRTIVKLTKEHDFEKNRTSVYF